MIIKGASPETLAVPEGELMPAAPAHDTPQEPLARRVFTLDDQRRFAALTGDGNPVHLSPLAARRTLVGQVVVHGMHTVAWALDALLAAQSHAAQPARWAPTKLAATFPKPVFVDADVEVYVVSQDDDAVHLRAIQSGMPVMELRLNGGRGGPEPRRPRLPAGAVAALEPPRAEPAVRTSADLEGLSGSVNIVQAPSALEAAFPTACAVLGTTLVAELIALSTVVGMECPGMHSLLSGVNVQLDAGAPAAAADPIPPITYEVRRFAPTYSLVDMAVQASGLTGSVMAFLRPSPAVQQTVTQVASHVRRGEFDGQRALIVGGSRGLGELTAKIVAAGGGSTLITYRQGEADALAVAAEIRAHGGHCDIVPFDIANPDGAVAHIAERIVTGSLPEDLWPPTHLYYFATPRIFARKASLFDDSLFSSFSAFYVSGFLNTVMSCAALTEDAIRVLYPSSVAIEEGLPELSEYAAAKAAGEAVALLLDRSQRHVRVVCKRLPRMPTDQTLNIQHTPAHDPLPVMLEAVRALDH